jgi:hypothetical protein
MGPRSQHTFQQGFARDGRRDRGAIERRWLRAARLFAEGLPPRGGARVDLTDQEATIHRRLEEYLRYGFDAARSRRDRLLAFEMVTFQRLLTSSSAALASALANRRRRLLREAQATAELTDEPDEGGEASVTPVLPGLQEEVAVLDSLILSIGEVTDSKVEMLVQLVETCEEPAPDLEAAFGG